MKKAFLFFSFVAIAIACSSSDDSDNPTGTDYNRTALLTNWADNIIIPSYKNYQSKVNDLSAKSTAFIATPTLDNLSALRTSWLESYKAYQYVSMYSFGKADQVLLKEMTNTYPADASAIQSNIASGTYNLALFSQIDKQGFPALDYLINGLDLTDAQILTFYTINANANGYKQYLNAVVARLKTNIDAVVADWNGGYRDTYIASNGLSVSSSVNKTVNNFVKNLERDIRNGKVGIPAGEFSNGTTYPASVEAYYKGDVSKELLIISMQATRDFFSGKHFNSGTYGEGLESYLNHINAVRSGALLSNTINGQFDAVLAEAQSLNDNFSQQIITDNSKMTALYDKIQQAVVLAKLDMMQALNITVDYVDGDGD